MCATDLTKQPMGEYRSAPSSRPITPEPDDGDDESAKMMKVSFRKGGDKLCYAVLKRSLKSKAWEVRSYIQLINAKELTLVPDFVTIIGRQPWFSLPQRR